MHAFIKKVPSRFLLLLLFVSASALVRAQQNATSSEWVARDPFIHKVFIENTGQWNSDAVAGKPKILFGLANAAVQVYFTPNGLVYYYDEVIDKHNKREEKEESREERENERKDPPVHKPHYVSMQWANMNPACKIITQEKETYYFTYSSAVKADGYKAAAFKKIIYKDLYPGIDAEYFFPSDKEGFKYTLVVHPGADITAVKMIYQNAAITKDGSGNALIKTSFGTITDHAPVSFYADNTSSAVASSFTISKNTVGFNLQNYDPAKTVIIDPWTITPTFANYNSGYDVDFDNAGNVYVYGGRYPYELIKYTSGGTLVWVLNTGVFTPWTYYGDFAIDPQTGTAFVIECWNYAAQILKVNTSGQQSGLFAGNSNFQEIYRVLFDNCNKKIIMAGGAYGTNAATIDTALSSLNLVNILNTSEIGHDMQLLAQDNTGNCFMATNAIGTTFNNVFLKCPSSTLSPASYILPDNHNFQESGSIPYINGALTRAGYNGMAANNNFLYTYDGRMIQRWDKNTGTLMTAANIGSTPFAWGGVDVDNCGRVYAGVQNNIYEYDTTFALTSLIASMSGRVFDVKISKSNVMYACGDGFVMKKELNVPVCSGMELSAASYPCLTTGSATVTVTGNTGPYSYYWNPSGMSTAQVSGLPGGTYTVTVKDAACIPNTATVSVFIGSAGQSLASITGPDTVCKGAAIALIANGGTSFTWSNGDTTKKIVVYPETSSSFSVVVSAGPGCEDTAVAEVAVIDWPLASVSGNDTVCSKNETLLTASGGEYYYWSTGEITPEIIVEPLVTSSYWVAVSNGYCTDTAMHTVVVKESPPAAAELIWYGDFVANLSAQGGTYYNWYPSEGLSCTDCPEPVATLDRTTTYCVSVVDETGCADTACVTIVISSVFVPNAFTPDEDRRNDHFKPVVTDVHNYHFAIFNKWGEMLFETSDKETGWDGYYKGRPCQLDVYVYKLWFTDDQYNEDHEIIGRVTLLR
jgi:gliding motility-associated-like protein